MTAENEAAAKGQGAPRVSIIVPVYNVEAYLRRCLNSILAQTIPDWECICVDDGSPDGCGAILDEYAAKDVRFVVIHKENGGVSAARNAGLDAARGEYIGFVDPDDWIEPNTYELALGAAERTGADIVQWRSIAENGRAPVPQRELPEGFFDVTRDDRYTSIGVLNLIFRRALVLGNRIRFPVGIRNGEDGYFTMIAYVCAKKCFFINRALYHHDGTRPNSATKDKTFGFRMEFVESRRRACEFIEEMMCRETARQRDSETARQRDSETAVAKFLLMRKLDAKQVVFLQCPSYSFFRSIFPETNRHALLWYFLKKRRKLSFVTLLVTWHLDAPARLLVWAWKKVTGAR